MTRFVLPVIPTWAVHQKKGINTQRKITLSAHLGIALTKDTVFSPHYMSSRLSLVLWLVEKDERLATKERMWFLLWSLGVMGEQMWGRGVGLFTLGGPLGCMS